MGKIPFIAQNSPERSNSICWGRIGRYHIDSRENFDECEHFAIFHHVSARRASLPTDANVPFLACNSEAMLDFGSVSFNPSLLLINNLCQSNVSDASCLVTQQVNVRVQDGRVDRPVVFAQH